MAGFPRRVAQGLMIGLGFVVVLAAAATLPQAPLEAAASLAAQTIHLACALLAGVALLRIPRWQPEGVPDLLVSSIALGLALQALLTLLVTGLGLTHRSVAWLVDALLFAIGAGQGRLFLRYVRDAWVRAELSFVMASRIPLLAVLAVVAVMHVVPPLVPPAAGTGGEQLALPTQALLRGDLREAVIAQPGATVHPSTGLLLHGELASGHSGAGLHGLTLMLLLTAAIAIHAHRHCGGLAAGWASLAFASAPAAVLLSAGDTSLSFVALYSFLAFHEVADWCASPSGGKIVLGSMYAGVALAESPAGGSLLVALLLFLFLTQAFVDRHGVIKQVPGVLGIAGIALLVALPYVGVSSLASTSTLGTHLKESFVGTDADAADDGGAGGDWKAAPWQVGTDGVALHVHEVALSFGPLLLGVLLLIPLVQNPSDGLRHGFLAAALSAAVWSLPPPFGTAAGLLPLLALCAGATAAGLLESTRLVSRSVVVLLSIALPVTILLGFTLGPNSLSGASYIVGASSRTDYLAGRSEDVELVTALENLRSAAREKPVSVLLVGELSDWHYTVPRERWSSSLPEGELLARALRTSGLSHVAVNLASSGGAATFAALREVASFGPEGALKLYAVPTEAEAAATKPAASQEPEGP